MSYLEMLQKQKEASEKYERDLLTLKQEILVITELHSKYNGDYLDELIQFNKTYVEMKES